MSEFRWSARTRRQHELSQRLSACLDMLAASPSRLERPHYLAEGLRDLVEIDPRADLPGIARIVWSVFLTRHLGVDELTDDNLETCRTRLETLSESQCDQAVRLMSELLVLVREAAEDDRDDTSDQSRQGRGT